jgi:hypothetical protein
MCLIGVAAMALGGCDFNKLVNTNDSESVAGRGSRSFDPYSGDSGAVRLSLQAFNGCAVLASGQPVAKGAANIPYPAQCPSPLAADPNASLVTPTARMQVVSGTKYFLNQLTLTDSVLHQNTNFARPQDAANWFAHESRFKALDWEGLGITTDEWLPFPGSFTREVQFSNANWQLKQDDTFLVEVLDTAGVVRGSQTYSRADFLAEASVAGHSRISWDVEGLAPPQFPGDPVAHPAAFGAAPNYRTTFRMDLTDSTNPFKQLTVPGALTGDGAFRVTWSALPGTPFYFPVTFVEKSALPATCYAADGGTERVACDFGLQPDFAVTRPANGKGYYEPGETFRFLIASKDDEGHLLHAPDALPSFDEFVAGQANGLLYYSPAQANEQEEDADSTYAVVGPIQDLRPFYDLAKGPSYFSTSDSLISNIAGQGQVPGLSAVRWPTREDIQLPANAKPGTYVALLKLNRQFYGERLTRTKAAFIQVGQTERTAYPGRVGNCQICHRGVISMENVRHGLSVDHLEACKACHLNRLSVEIHQIHFRSTKYPMAKNDCTVCHLTRESATRPSYDVCASCHPSVHGGKYANLEFEVLGTPNRFSNCAQSCHVVQTPTAHVLPPL